jgi:hypothetical protein
MSLLSEEERAQRRFVWVGIMGAVALLLTFGIALT